ncbi:HSF-type DNA-binding-domain-containing protein [Absidia repens]|uniref:HSF-type DNA-binding-domain-containing protein n=1 Tax=Absidia repens TaxID=90262 RepID=A0A1X2HYF2_9FUNG|nr:HSF-type DNA-binding-domain-containing protein [Absidia repens]
MHHRRTLSNTSSDSTGYSVFENSSISTSSGSPPECYNPNSQQLLSVQQIPKTTNSNTFVHKLYNMVLDDQFQHLISWSYTGSSFIVCNIMEFSRDVLPKHFKHNNFSSFVRQLNMYGFHKVNKSPRGHRTLAENQIWEFSHERFVRGRAELLDDIKRKTMETTDSQQQQQRQNGDLHAHVNLLQSSHSEMMQQMAGLLENFNHVVKELDSTKRKMASQDHLLHNMMQYICHQNNGQLPAGFNMDVSQINTTPSVKSEKDMPSIFITSHAPTPSHSTTPPPAPLPAPLKSTEMNHDMLNIHDTPITPTSIGPRSPHALNSYLPPSPSASTMLSEDDLDPTRNYHQQHQHQHHHHHRRHLSAGATPLSAQGLHSHFTHYQHQSLQPTLTPNDHFDFVNPHNPLAH